MIVNADEGRPGRSLPLLERDRELRRIAGALRDPLDGRGSLFVVEGPAGIGRSRLLLEVARRARRRHGIAVLQLRAGALEAGARRLPADLSRTLVIVDDVQCCDQVQLDGCLAGARERGARVLIARRTGAAPRSDPWAPDRLRGDRSAAILRLDPLSDRAVGVLLARLCGSVPDREFAMACRRSTGGNPALVGELALALVERTVAPVASNVGLAQRLGLAPVGRRVVSCLDRSTTALLTACAVLGEGSPIMHAITLAGMSERRVRTALEALRRHAVLGPGDRVRFVQPLVGRSILAAARPSDLARWHRRAADVLDAADAPFGEIAAQLIRAAPAGDRGVVGRLRLGAHRARQVGDCAAAAAHLQRALQEGVPEFERDLAVELARVLARRSPADAIVLLERALRLTAAAGERTSIEEEVRRLERELAAATGG